MRPIQCAADCADELLGAAAKTLSAALTPDERAEILAGASLLWRERGETILIEDEKGRDLFYIIHGAVRLTRMNAAGDRLITGFLFTGDFLGACVAERYPFNAEAVENTALCRFDREMVVKASRTYPGVLERMINIASNEFLQCQLHLEIVMGGSVEAKLSRFLLATAERLAVTDAGGRVVELPMGREDIADYLGHSVEAVSRAFSRLREIGAIATPHRSCVVINDEAALAAAAERSGAG